MLLGVGAISSRISMRAGSKVSASRARLGRTPSIHSVSALTWKNGAWPSKGSALTTRPSPPRRVIDDLVGQIMDINNSLADAGVAEFIEHMIEQRPACHLHQRL